MDKPGADSRSPRPVRPVARSSSGRSLLGVAGWVVAGLLFVYVAVDKLGPAATTQAPGPGESVEPTAALSPGPSQLAASADPRLDPTARPETEPTPAATESLPAPQPSASAPTPPSAEAQPTPDPAAAQREMLGQQFRQRIADAKARLEALQAAVAQECPELKPGEIRLPAAVSQCARLSAHAAEAEREYEEAKKQALAAGFNTN